jgi:hypothetical protein
VAHAAGVPALHRWHPIRILLNNIRYSLMDEKYLGEQALRASGVPYTVVRPGGLTDLPGGKEAIAVGEPSSACYCCDMWLLVLLAKSLSGQSCVHAAHCLCCLARGGHHAIYGVAMISCFACTLS